MKKFTALILLVFINQLAANVIVDFEVSITEGCSPLTVELYNLSEDPENEVNFWVWKIERVPPYVFNDPNLLYVDTIYDISNHQMTIENLSPWSGGSDWNVELAAVKSENEICSNKKMELLETFHGVSHLFEFTDGIDLVYPGWPGSYYPLSTFFICPGYDSICVFDSQFGNPLWYNGSTENCIAIDFEEENAWVYYESNTSGCGDTLDLNWAPAPMPSNFVSLHVECDYTNFDLLVGQTAWNFTGPPIGTVTENTSITWTFYSEGYGCTVSQTVDFYVNVDPYFSPVDQVINCNDELPYEITLPDTFLEQLNSIWSPSSFAQVNENKLLIYETGLVKLRWNSISNCQGGTEFNLNYQGLEFENNLDYNICNSELPITLTAPWGDTFLWNTGSTNNTISIDTAGLYSVEAIDENGCGRTFDFNYIADRHPSNVDDILICDYNLNPISFCAEFIHTIDTYNWSNGDNTRCTEFYEPGVYELTTIDDFGCSKTQSLLVDFIPPFKFETTQSDTQVICNSVQEFIWPNTNCLLEDFVEIPLNQLVAFIAECTEDTCSTFSTYYLYADTYCVERGDTDNDSFVNNFDLLNIGVAFGTHGIARTINNENYLYQGSISWENEFATNINYKHADCNGDGVINEFDVNLVNEKYDFTHVDVQLSENPFNSYLLSNNITATSINFNDTIAISFLVGNELSNPENLHGAAFTINYAKEIFEIDFTSNSYWGDDFLELKKEVNNGMDVAFSQKSTDGIKGVARLFTIKLFFKDIEISESEVIEILNNGGNQISITNLKIIDNLGNLIPAVLPNHFVVDLIPTSTNPLSETSIEFGPNPFNKYLNINLQDLDEEIRVKIYSITGQKVIEENVLGGKIIITTDDLSHGLYLVHLESENLNHVVKLEKLK